MAFTRVQPCLQCSRTGPASHLGGSVLPLMAALLLRARDEVLVRRLAVRDVAAQRVDKAPPGARRRALVLQLRVVAASGMVP